MPTDRADRNPRVGVYIDFDNVVISRYDQVHPSPRDAWRADRVRDLGGQTDGALAVKLDAARVDVGALLDYAASFGRVSFARAYADWSVPANAAYRHQLVDRAVDLTQLFPVSRTKNGADIRLAVDAVTDLTDDEGITHVVLVAGDSDYIALAQRCKKLGRYVIGIGVTGSTSRALVAACDEFSSYDDLPGVLPVEPAEVLPSRSRSRGRVAAAQASAEAVETPVRPQVQTSAETSTERVARTSTEAAPAEAPRQRSRTKKPLPPVDGTDGPAAVEAAPAEAPPAKKAATRKTTARTTAAKKTTVKKAAAKKAVPEAVVEPATDPVADPVAPPPAKNAAAPRRATRAATTAAPVGIDPETRRQSEATDLLVRALRVARDRADTPDEWLHGGGVKSQMQRMDGSFKEKALGFKTFSAFVESRGDVVESRSDAGDGHLRLRLRP